MQTRRDNYRESVLVVAGNLFELREPLREANLSDPFEWFSRRPILTRHDHPEYDNEIVNFWAELNTTDAAGTGLEISRDQLKGAVAWAHQSLVTEQIARQELVSRFLAGPSGAANATPPQPRNLAQCFSDAGTTRRVSFTEPPPPDTGHGAAPAPEAAPEAAPAAAVSGGQAPGPNSQGTSNLATSDLAAAITSAFQTMAGELRQRLDDRLPEPETAPRNLPTFSERDVWESTSAVVRAQLHGDVPRQALAPHPRDVRTMWLSLTQAPPTIAPLEELALGQSPNPGTSRKKYEHRRGASAAEEYALLEKYLRILAHAGATLAGPQFAFHKKDGEPCVSADVTSDKVQKASLKLLQDEATDQDEEELPENYETRLIYRYTETINFACLMRQHGIDKKFDGAQAREHVDLVIDRLKDLHNDGSTGARAVKKLADQGLANQVSSRAERKRPATTPTSSRQAPKKKKEAVCFDWGKHHLEISEKKCPLGKKCQWRHNFKDEAEKAAFKARHE